MSATLEQTSVDKGGNLTPFDSERARLAGLRSAELKKQRLADVDKKLNPPATAKPDNVDEYREKRLMRVRAQLDRVDHMLMLEKEPQALDRLASACARLSELERQLAGRPLPGSLRPTNKPARASTTVEPSAPE